MAITRKGQLTAELQTGIDVFVHAAGGANSFIVSNDKAKTGSYSYRHGATNNAFGFFVGSISALRMGFWLNHIGLSNSTTAIARLVTLERAAGGTHLVRWNENTNTVQLLINGVLQDEINQDASGITDLDSWMHGAIVFKVGNPGFASFYLDGIQILHYEGDTSSNITHAYVGGFTGLTGWMLPSYWDDIYVDELTDGDAVDHIPPGKRFTFHPVDEAGSSAQWTAVGAASNHQAVDENPNNEDTDYNRATAADLVDLFGVSTYATPAEHVIRAALPIAVARRIDPGTQSQIRFKAVNGVDTIDGVDQLPTTAYNVYWEHMTEQPAGGAWSDSAFNNTEWGYESRGDF